MLLFTKGRDFAELLLIVEPLNGGWDLIVYKGKYVSKNFPKILFSATWVLRGFWGFHVKFILVRYGSAWTAPPSPNRYVRAVVIFACHWKCGGCVCGSDFLFAVQPQNRKILVQKSKKRRLISILEIFVVGYAYKDGREIPRPVYFLPLVHLGPKIVGRPYMRTQLYHTSIFTCFVNCNILHMPMPSKNKTINLFLNYIFILTEDFFNNMVEIVR